MVPRRAEHARTGQLHRPETDTENTEMAEGVTLHAPSLGTCPSLARVPPAIHQTAVHPLGMVLTPAVRLPTARRPRHACHRNVGPQLRADGVGGQISIGHPPIKAPDR